MDSLTVFASFVVGLLLRFGLPVGLTALLILWLRRLDQHWQREVEEGMDMEAMGTSKPCNPGCWKIKGCSPEQCSGCEAYFHQEMPCWQYFRNSKGILREKCLGCDVFKEAPLTVAA